jgi:hypothetical protein
MYLSKIAYTSSKFPLSAESEIIGGKAYTEIVYKSNGENHRQNVYGHSEAIIARLDNELILEDLSPNFVLEFLKNQVWENDVNLDFITDVGYQTVRNGWVTAYEGERTFNLLWQKGTVRVYGYRQKGNASEITRSGGIGLQWILD